MIERDKKYYNRKISELYAVIENQEKIIRDLQEEKLKLKKITDYIENYYCLDYEDLLEILKGEDNEKGSKR